MIFRSILRAVRSFAPDLLVLVSRLLLPVPAHASLGDVDAVVGMDLGGLAYEGLLIAILGISVHATAIIRLHLMRREVGDGEKGRSGSAQFGLAFTAALALIVAAAGASAVLR
jgi:hypothetical protein